jgi:hypothetical protein
MQFLLAICVAALLILQASAKHRSLVQVGRSLEQVDAISLGACEGFAIMAGSTATCAGSFDCDIIGGKLGVSPGTSYTGNFVGDIVSTPDSAGCATDGLAALAAGIGRGGTVNMAAEMGGLTFTPGVHTHGSAINIALANPEVYLDAEGNPNAVFIFVAGSTLTTCAHSKIVLLNNAKAENVFWVLGTALTLGNDSIFMGTVLAGSAITINTNGKICGRAIAQTAVTCETHCTVGFSADCWGQGGGAYGDPHLKTWTGDKYDYHGVCDLVLLQNPNFASGLGMDIHMRTNLFFKQFSYISTAVLRIGDETLEVMGGKNENSYWINNVFQEDLERGISGYPISFRQVDFRQREFVVALNRNGDSITFKTYKDFVSIGIHTRNSADFGSSLGLMGTFDKGIKLGRDNSTVHKDANAFGEEWQVLADEPMLFHNVAGPQAPEKCDMPTQSVQRRRLGANHISQEDAETACGRVNANDFDACVFDVMATNDKELAGSY